MKSMRSRALLALAMLLAIRFGTPAPARAQAVRTRILAGMEVDQTDEGWSVRVGFTSPVQYLRHSPESFGDVLEIQLNLIAVSQTDAAFSLARESIQVPPGMTAPIRSIDYDGRGNGGPTLTFRFTRPVEFEVKQERDFRGIVVRVRRPRRPSSGRQGAPPLPPPPESELPPGGEAAARPVRPLPAEQQQKVDDLAREARSAMTAGELDRAVLLLTKVLTFPENPRTPEAKELLGLARQRNGQLAHAKAEYEEYLERYPAGEGADRVRQRLDALVTAREEPREPLPEGRRVMGETRFDGYGSLFTSYFRSEALDAEGFEDSVRASDSFSDVFLAGRADHPAFSLKGQLAGSYRYDLADSSSEVRASTLLVDIANPDRSLFSVLGRQSMSTRGVLGRFDGGRATWRFFDKWDVTAVGGFPVESLAQQGVQTDKVFYGLSLGGERIVDGFDADVFAVLQTAFGLVDRTGVGAEVRWSDNGHLVTAFVDYDAYHRELNTAFAIGNFRLTDETRLNLLADHRNSPILTTSNALIGQPVGDLEELRRLFSKDEIRSLADDRTARTTTATAGLSHQLTPRYQLAGDVTAFDFSGTPASGGVPETQGTGFEFSYFLQLIAADFLTEGGVGTLGLRYFDGSLGDSISVLTNGRFPAIEGLWASPRLVVSYRNLGTTRSDLLTRPAVRLEYRRWQAILDVEGGLDWLQALGPDAVDDLGYTVNVGVRLDF